MPATSWPERWSLTSRTGSPRTAEDRGSRTRADPGGGDAHSTIRFSLAGARTSAGLFLCEETDAASLRVSPLTRVATLHRRALTGEPDCTVEFRVTVPRGEVGFLGELQGGERPLMRGVVPRFQAREDGFVVQIDLSEIDALDVETRTIGLGGPASYEFEVEGSPTPFPIGKDDRDTLAAIAGGPRFVTLHPEPCVVVNGPARRPRQIRTIFAAPGEYDRPYLARWAPGDQADEVPVREPHA